MAGIFFWWESAIMRIVSVILVKLNDFVKTDFRTRFKRGHVLNRHNPVTVQIPLELLPIHTWDQNLSAKIA